MRFLNLLRQDVRIVPDTGDEIIIPSSGLVYVSEQVSLGTMVDDLHGPIPTSVVSANVVNAPDPLPDVAYIVNWKVLQAMRAQGYDVSDVYCPDTMLREGGRITGSRRLIRYVSDASDHS